MAKINLASGQATAPGVTPQPVMVGMRAKPPGRKLENWLKTYGEYTSENEAPAIFHLWTGLGTLAGALQRKVAMHTPHYDVLSNLYIVLVAPPGTARKTTALKIGRTLLKEVPGVHFTTKATSPAALIKQLSDLPNKVHQSLTAYSYELGSFFSTQPAEMVDISTDLYDGNPDWDKQTIARGMEKITRPWLNLMAATTPQWLGDYMSPTAVEGGFVSRTIFVYADTRQLSNPFPQITAEHKQLKALLINDLTHISMLEGEVKLTPEAEEYYTKWYLNPRSKPTLMDNRTGGYFERKPMHVLKVAMGLSVAHSDSLIIGIAEIKLALALLKEVEPKMRQAFSTVGRNTFATDIERILHQVKTKGAMSYKEIMQANYHALEKRQIDTILEQLTDMGAINLNGGRVYKPIEQEETDDNI